MITLSRERKQELVDVLAEAFTAEDLEFKVADPLLVPRDRRSGARKITERAWALVRWADERGQLERLLTTALSGNPSSLNLRRFNESVGLLPPSSALLDAVVREGLLSPDATEAWQRGLAESQRQVCSVRPIKAGDTKGFRTGFLVGDDQVMTVVAGRFNSPAHRFACVFDDVTVGLDPVDPIVVKSGEVYVLRLERPLGRELVQGSANVAVRARGWISPTRQEPLATNTLLAIVQYAESSVRVAVDGRGLVGIDGDELIYTTATLPESRGAPCFDQQWRLLAVHFEADKSRGQNRGRRVEAIARDLAGKGFRWDAAHGVHRAASAEPATRAGGLDAVIRGLGSSIADEGVWSDEVDDLGLPVDDRWAWVEAAAAHATFDPGSLVPFGNASADARVALLIESRQVGARWVLNDQLRKVALKRLAARNALAAARAANPADLTDRLEGGLVLLIGGGAPTPAELRDPDSLRSLLTAADWLGGVTSPPLPGRDELRAALERAMLLAPFRHLTRGFFAGREAEMARLLAYCNDPHAAPPFIHGPGGMGKSALLAHFVLANAERDPMDALAWRPFVYLDFDRPELDATDLPGVLLAIVRQLGPQVPLLAGEAQRLADVEAERRRTVRRSPRGSGRRQANLAAKVAPDQIAEALREVTRLFSALGPTPIVLILDTLEEVQFANPDAIGPLVDFVVALKARVPQFRPILAGRIAVDEGVDPMALEGLPRAACEALLDNELPPNLASRTDLVSRLAEVVGTTTDRGELRGNPLSLRLAAEVLRREAADPERVIEELDGVLRNRVTDAIVQGRLYERILRHLHDPRVEAIAHPGLALRAITWELIRDVLAGPCGLGALDEPAARGLFDALAKEVALVRQGRDPDELELRPELRRIVRIDLANDTASAAQRAQIHAAAMAYYEVRGAVADRAEEIYHRLAAGEDPDQVDRRWREGVEPYLRDAVGELSPQANAYLANRVGGVASEEQAVSAAPIEWEEYVARRAGDLLKFGQPEKALALMASRTERLPTSRLYYVESVARRMLPEVDLAGAEAAAERAVAAARVSSNSDDLRDALEELVQVRRLREDTTGVLRALAELGNLGDALGDDLVVLQSNIEGLEALGNDDGRERFTESAVRVFNRLPDALVAKAPELSRRVAAQVGRFDAATLQRVLRLVGTGALDEAAAAGLHEVLSEWRDVDPSIGALVPDVGRPPREMASAARYLASNREMDAATAGQFARWLGTVVTPKPASLSFAPLGGGMNDLEVAGTRSPGVGTSGGAVAGFARLALPIPPGKPLAGYSLGGSGKGEWTRNPLHVRAMFLRDAQGERVAVAVVELMSASRYLHERVAAITGARCGLGLDRLILCGTHTHTGPGGFYGNSLYDTFAAHTPGFDRDLADAIARTVADAVLLAVARAVPATVRVDVERAWGASHNRSLPAFQCNEDHLLWNTLPSMPGHAPPPGLGVEQQRIDPRVTVLSAYDAGGHPLGVFATFACHNTALGPHPASGASFYDPDWAGVTARVVEADQGGPAVVLMALSGAGDQSPMPPPSGAFHGPNKQGAARADWVGSVVADKIRHAFRRGPTGSVAPSLRVAHREWWTAPAPGGDPAWNDLSHARLAPWCFGASTLAGAEDGRSPFFPALAREGMTSNLYAPGHPQHPKAPALGPLQPMLKGLLALAPSPVRSLHVLRVGDHVFATVPGEPTVWAAHQIEEAVRGATGSASASVLGYAGDYAGYFTTRSEFRAQQYEGSSMLFGSESGDHLTERLAQLARSTAGERRDGGLESVQRFVCVGACEAPAAEKGLPPPAGQVEPDRLVVAWTFPRAEAPKDFAVTVTELVDGRERPVRTAGPLRSTPHATWIGATPATLWTAEIPLSGATSGRRFRARSGDEVLDLGDVEESGLESMAVRAEAVAEPTLAELDADALESLLAQQPDGGRALLASMLPSADPGAVLADLRREREPGLEAIWPLPSHPEVDAVQLAAFAKRFAGAVDPLLTVEDVRSTAFQEQEDWRRYLFAPGAVRFHLGGALAPPLWPSVPRAALTYDLDPALDLRAAPLSVALFADFGNGLPAARAIAKQITGSGLPYAFHLGDVYYAGTEAEFRDFFAQPLEPMLETTELFMLSGNHEMYARGETFQRYLRAKADRHPGRQRQRAEVFRLRGHGLQIIGLDSMWCGWQGGFKRLVRRDSHLDAETVALLQGWIDDAPSGCLTILLTSDEPWSIDARSKSRLLKDLEPIIRGGGIDLWFWGNVHHAALYDAWQFPKATEAGFVGSCIGHGGYPFRTVTEESAPEDVDVRWWEQRHRFWPEPDVRPDVGLNGWCEMALQRGVGGWEVSLRYRDWVGRDRLVARIEKHDGGAARIATVEENLEPDPGRPARWQTPAGRKARV